MDLTDFNSNYLNQLLQNISKDQKSIFLLRDFNANLMNYNEHKQKNDITLQPTRITSHSNALVDNNIFKCY